MFILDLRWLLFFFLLLITLVIYFLVTWQDRWRQRKRKMVLPNPEEMLTVLEYAPFGWLVLEKASSYSYANPYARRLFGLSSDRGLFPQAEWSQALGKDYEAAQGQPHGIGQYRSVSISSGRTIRWWITTRNDRSFVFLLDVTTHQRAEQAISYLFSALSHELRTPLGTILTHLEVLRLPDIPGETREQSLRLLKAETKQLSQLVNQMLELGRLETSSGIERRPVDLLTLVEKAIARLSARAEERRIDLSLQSDAPLPLVLGDKGRLTQVFSNLLENAIKYCRPGDQVEVCLGPTKAGVRCSVRDSGPGIPAEHLPHITRPFYRAVPQEADGIGLGLALVKEILRRHQSELEIESEAEGKKTGTRVCFVLPILLLEEEKLT